MPASVVPLSHNAELHYTEYKVVLQTEAYEVAVDFTG